MRLAIMQPYYAPYVGYYRLFAAADKFVILDSVQFNRRGRTHRTELSNGRGGKHWLTLPIKRTARDTTRICDLEWGEDAGERWNEQRQAHHCTTFTKAISELQTPLEFIVDRIQYDCAQFGISYPEPQYASNIPTPPHLTGEQRIIHICKYLGATRYINAPGGLGLYRKVNFDNHGIALEFLQPYRGSYCSTIERFANEDRATIYKEMMENLCVS